MTDDNHNGKYIHAPHLIGFFPENAVYTEQAISTLLDEGVQTAKARVIFGENKDTDAGVDSVEIGNHYFVDGGDLRAWVKAHAKPQRRSKTRGGVRSRGKGGKRRCPKGGRKRPR